ncbi:MAG: crotonase/enoyl-CoA hydratase family protein [Acidimicrobiales bacterium]
MNANVQNVRDRIKVRRIGPVADVRLDRPDKMNALDPEMFRALVETSDELAKDTSVRAVVLSGEGPSFCAGLDFVSFLELASGGEQLDLTATAEDRITHFAQQAVFGWTELRVPVIAAVEGHALGGGIQLALGADIRIVHPDAKLSVLEIRWGLIPDMTGTQMLVDLVGVDVAKELTFTGRSVSGSEARDLGLATKVSETPRADAMELANVIASKSPHAIRAGKRLLSEAARFDRAANFERERIEISRLIGSPNQSEAVAAFFEKRDPQFSDPALSD